MFQSHVSIFLFRNFGSVCRGMTFVWQTLHSFDRRCICFLVIFWLQVRLIHFSLAELFPNFYYFISALWVRFPFFAALIDPWSRVLLKIFCCIDQSDTSSLFVMHRAKDYRCAFFQVLVVHFNSNDICVVRQDICFISDGASSAHEQRISFIS